MPPDVFSLTRLNERETRPAFQRPTRPPEMVTPLMVAVTPRGTVTTGNDGVGGFDGHEIVAGPLNAHVATQREISGTGA